MLLNPATQGSNPNAPDFFSEEKIVHVAEVNQQHCLEEIEQWLDDRSHLALASGKLVLQLYVKDPGRVRSETSFVKRISLYN